jgi:hypothetical protein
MANTNGTTNAVQIAQEALVQLKAQLPFITQIASDHTQDGAKFGEQIIVHEVQATTADDFNPATGYVAKARTQVDIPVTINKHKHHTYSVGVQEASSSRVDLIKRYALNAAYALGFAIVSDVAALVKAAAFANKTFIALGAAEDGFNRKGVVRVGKALSKRGVSPAGRFLLLNSDYWASLLSDDSLLNLLALSGRSVIESNSLDNVHGFSISEFVDLPDNGENLVGFGGLRTGLAFATRLPDDPCQGQPGGTITVVKDEATGISLQVREWCNWDLGEFKRAYTFMYGVGAGQVGAIQRVVSKE